MRLSFAIFAVCVVACQPPQEKNLDGGDDAVRGAAPELVAKLSIGAVLTTTREVNLRDAPNPESRVLRVLAAGAEVIVVRTTGASDGFLSVAHQGLQGWINGNAVAFVSGPTSPEYKVNTELPEFIDMTPDVVTPGVSVDAPPPPPPPEELPAEPPPPTKTPRDDAIERAQSGLGFSYWWGGAKWDPAGSSTANKGSCTGVCPDCGHSGQFGADCSGYVAKVWQVPDWNTDLMKNQHPYSTYAFVNASYEWSDVSRDNLKKADALVYNTDGRGHIMLYESGDGWGQMWTYESRGCSTGIVHNLRTVDQKYKGIKRDGW